MASPAESPALEAPLPAAPVIWQYWETRGIKPAFVDGLFEIAKRNAGVSIVRVTPENIASYLPPLEPCVSALEHVAHKADVIRARLLYRHGGMWLDSDAIVLRDLQWLFRLLEQYEFVGFADQEPGNAQWDVKINCFLARAGSDIVARWIEAQNRTLQQGPAISWTSLGDPLGEICRQAGPRAKILPFNMVCPIRWDRVERFMSRLADSRSIVKEAHIVMLSNKALQDKQLDIVNASVEDLSSRSDLLADIVRKAIDPAYVPPSRLQKTWTLVREALGG